MKKNILISATRQWNPGDEFIMFGVMNILDEIGIKYNPILYNRSPEIRDGRKYSNLFKTKQIAENIEKMHLLRIFKGGFRDNSFKNGTDESIIDIVIFAGSPEWYGYRVKTLYELIKKRNVPYAFIGIGMGDSKNFNKLENIYYDVIKKCPLITTRDHQTYNMISKYNKNVCYLTCPAMLAAKNDKIVTSVKKVALIYATYKTLFGNKVSKQTYLYLKALYKKIIKCIPYKVEIVCHYIDEIEETRKDFPGCNINYSFDARDYEKIYNQFDFVVGGRVHGIGMCASLGIPGVMISHDIRSETVMGFHAKILSVGTDLNSALDIIKKEIKTAEYKSLELVKVKQNIMEEYVELFKNSGLKI